MQQRSKAVLVAITLLTACSMILPGLTEISAPSNQSNRSSVTYLHVGGGTLQVEIGPGELELSRIELLNWVRSCARSVSAYFGQFPTKKAIVKLVPKSGKGIGFSTATYEDDTGIITVPVGRRTTLKDLKNDWILTHEMVHLGFPLTGEKHRWLAEGMATYVEPLARLRTGQIPVQEVWEDLVKMLPRGLPRDGDKGLNRTPTWGRVYWGGALYFLLADLEIRKRTNNRKGLEHALGAIAAAGGGITSEWEPLYALEIGDKAVGTTVLADLYHEMKARPVSVDLPRLWKLLGVSSKQGSLVFDNRAPLANVRESINRGT